MARTMSPDAHPHAHCLIGMHNCIPYGVNRLSCLC